MIRHPYIPNSASFGEMLSEIGARGAEDLFVDLPMRGFSADLVPAIPMGEAKVEAELSGLLSDVAVNGELNFIGGGPWRHFIPSAIKHIISRGEFLTSYTPYQPEISQGMLQALFEYQSMVCELYEMDVANASMYDLATAAAEAALLCARFTGRSEFIIPESLPWERKSVIRNYTEPQGIRLLEARYSREDGWTDIEDLKQKAGSATAGIYIESPTYYGTIDPGIRAAADLAHDAGALMVAGADPLSLGMIKPPGSLGADVAVGDGQPLGIPPAFGGNGLGIFACKGEQRLLRQMPGRIVGMTEEVGGGARGYVLALATREQHIRRGRATSNICTNESLLALAAAAYMALMGRQGIRGVSARILKRTAYAKRRISEEGCEVRFPGASFRDFVVDFGDPRAEARVRAELRRNGMLGGRPMEADGIGIPGGAVFAVTELHEEAQIERLATALKLALRRAG